MDLLTYYREIIAINSANLAANLENLDINRQIMTRNAASDAVIISLLTEIRDLLRGGSDDSE